MAINLPPEISFNKEKTSIGWAYVFRHIELGRLGRLIMQGTPDGRTHMSLELAGDLRDPMTKERRKVFQPLEIEIIRQMDLATGGNGNIEDPHWVDPPKPTPPMQEKILTKLMQCETCQANVALLIFADDAQDSGGLEDSVRVMFPKIVELNLPTWVIGPMAASATPMQEPAMIRKVWPERGELFQAAPDQFNPMIDILMSDHCRNKPS